MKGKIFDDLFLDEEEQKYYELKKLASKFIVDENYKLEALRREAFDAYKDAMKKMKVYLKLRDTKSVEEGKE